MELVPYMTDQLKSSKILFFYSKNKSFSVTLDLSPEPNRKKTSDSDLQPCFEVTNTLIRLCSANNEVITQSD